MVIVDENVDAFAQQVFVNVADVLIVVEAEIVDVLVGVYGGDEAVGFFRQQKEQAK